MKPDFQTKADTDILCIICNSPHRHDVDAVKSKLPYGSRIVDAKTLRGKIETPWLSTGCLAIEFFLQNTDSPIYLTGFDSFKSAQLHYYSDNEKSNHSSEMELAYITQARATGRLFSL